MPLIREFGQPLDAAGITESTLKVRATIGSRSPDGEDSCVITSLSRL